MTDSEPDATKIPEQVEEPVVLPAEDEPWDAIALYPDGEHAPIDASPGQAEPVPGVDLLSAFALLGDRLESRLDRLQKTIEREIRAETTREKVVDRLHAELQEYKQDLLLNTLRPVFMDLIQLHDDIGKVAVLPEGESGPGALKRLVDLMEGFQQGIEDILYRQGVESFEVEGDGFEPRQQRAVLTIPNHDPNRHKTVAERLRKGFRSGDRVIRPEIVSVFGIKKSE